MQNNNNNNNNRSMFPKSDSTLTIQQQQKKMELYLVTRLVTALSSAVPSNANANLKLGPSERDLLRPYSQETSVLRLAFSASVFGLLTLSRYRSRSRSFVSPASHSQRHAHNSPFASAAGKSSSSSTIGPPPAAATEQMAGRWFSSSYGNGFANNLLLFSLDGFVSSVTGTLLSLSYMIYRYREKFFAMLSTIPLVEGPSLIVQQLCPVAMKEYRLIQQELQQEMNRRMPQQQLPPHNQYSSNDDSDAGILQMNDRYANHNENDDELVRILQETLQKPTDVDLYHLFEFCQNCAKRQAYEQQFMLQQQQLPYTSDLLGTIDVPAPGVPVDFVATNRNDDNHDDDHHNFHDGYSA